MWLVRIFEALIAYDQTIKPWNGQPETDRFTQLPRKGFAVSEIKCAIQCLVIVRRERYKAQSFSV